MHQCHFLKIRRLLWDLGKAPTEQHVACTVAIFSLTCNPLSVFSRSQLPWTLLCVVWCNVDRWKKVSKWRLKAFSSCQTPLLKTTTSCSGCVVVMCLLVINLTQSVRFNFYLVLQNILVNFICLIFIISFILLRHKVHYFVLMILCINFEKLICESAECAWNLLICIQQCSA